MRLVHIGSDGTLTVTSDSISQNNTPPYAILSHTWQTYVQEISFDDLKNNTGHEKIGYDKLRFCARQARKDGLSYLWMDTCCINTADHTELQEAINLTFRWAQNATKCYVWLSDVPNSSTIADSGTLSPNTIETTSNSWELALRKSRWFTRSWTLQELLAPPVVEFFSQDWSYLGSRSSLAEYIHEITDIPVAALHGAHLSKFSVEQKLSWGQKRQATREEDPAYSLLGIFDVFVPIIYGEGRRRAFSRLREAIEWSSGKDTREEQFRTRSQVLYRPLGKADIRILVLHPGEQNDDLRADLEQGSLSGALDYQALSYVWGQEPALHALRVNESEALYIKPNLFHALHRLRLPYGSVRLWIDSICINQSDEPERNQQVGQMGEIFRHAKNVWIWLGEEYADSNYAMDIIPQVNRPDYNWEDLWSHQHDFLAINQLLARPWFRRGWVIQEAAFASSSIVFCGNRRVDWRDLTGSVEKIKRHVSNALLMNRAPGLRSLCNNLYGSSASRLFDIVTGVFRLQRDGHVTKMLTLETLVGLGTSFETTDPRDTIYTLINLANNAKTGSPSEAHGIVVPDYRKSPVDVFAEFILHCSHGSGSLDIICRPWAPRRNYQTSERLEEEYPSWIRTRDQLPFGDPSERNSYRLHSNSMVEDCRIRLYNAHNHMPPQIRILRPNNACASRVSLLARGIRVGKIIELSMRMGSAIITSDCLRILRLGLLASGIDPSQAAESISQILIMDSPRHVRSGCNVGIRVIDLWRRLLGTSPDEASGIDIEDALESGLSVEVKDYLRLIRQHIWNRRSFCATSKTDRMSTGLVPQHASIGDELCILYGCSVPVVLRPVYTMGLGARWELIGEAYVYGYMDGEGLSCLSSEERASAEIDFEIQ